METREFTPQDRAIADEVVAARAASQRAVSGFHPGGWGRQVAGASAHYSGTPIATLNCVFVNDQEVVDPDQIDALLTEIAGEGRPCSLQLRGPILDRLRPCAERRGMRLEAVLPLMVVDPVGLAEAPLPDDCVVRVLEADEAEPHARLAAEGLGIPLSDMWAFLTPEALGSERWTTYLATVHGQPAATAAALVSGDHVGLMSIVTDPAHRGRGLAAGLTSLAVRRAFDAGIVRAFLQSSAAGYGVYERLGFREVEQWHVWA